MSAAVSYPPFIGPERHSSGAATQYQLGLVALARALASASNTAEEAVLKDGLGATLRQVTGTSFYNWSLRRSFAPGADRQERALPSMAWRSLPAAEPVHVEHEPQGVSQSEQDPAAPAPPDLTGPETSLGPLIIGGSMDADWRKVTPQIRGPVAI